MIKIILILHLWEITHSELQDFSDSPFAVPSLLALIDFSETSYRDSWPFENAISKVITSPHLLKVWFYQLPQIISLILSHKSTWIFFFRNSFVCMILWTMPVYHNAYIYNKMSFYLKFIINEANYSDQGFWKWDKYLRTDWFLFWLGEGI